MAVKTKVVLVSGENITKVEKKLITAAAKPGQLVASSTGGNVALAGASYAGPVQILDLSSMTGFDIDTAYAVDDQVPVAYPTKGMLVNVVLDATAGAVAAGAKLYWTGTGVKTVADTEPALFIAQEAKTYAATDNKIIAEVLV